MAGLLFSTAMLISAPASAGDLAATMVANVVQVLDGETLEVVAYPWPGLAQRAQVRLLDLQIPRTGSRARCDRERTMAELAETTARDFLAGREVMLTVVALDDFGRALGYVGLPTDSDDVPRDYAELMHGLGLAKPLTDLSGWCG